MKTSVLCALFLSVSSSAFAGLPTSINCTSGDASPSIALSIATSKIIQGAMGDVYAAKVIETTESDAGVVDTIYFGEITATELAKYAKTKRLRVIATTLGKPQMVFGGYIAGAANGKYGESMMLDVQGDESILSTGGSLFNVHCSVN